MAADTRVSYSNKANVIVGWDDYDNYRKAIDVNGVLYGFAGHNDYFIDLLEELLLNSDDVDVLDYLAANAKNKNQSFAILRYDGELRIFGYLDKTLYDSSSTVLNVSTYGIGSGANCDVYKRHKSNSSPMIPIRKIIDTNSKAIKKAKENDASIKKDQYGTICSQAGGDNGTGGVINMTTAQNSNAIVQEQLDTLRVIQTAAASLGAVAVCSLNESYERQKLEKLGVQASKNTQSVPNKEQQELHERMAKRMAERQADIQRAMESSV